ncbi:Phosphotransferase enzyme [Ceratobasidium sp. UAMH 11750]|nr:Phosphotransferase enzyme [Ceratobasidium sp. UAMH 11750]
MLTLVLPDWTGITDGIWYRIFVSFLAALFSIFIFWIYQPRRNRAANVAQYEEFFEYTSGRWLYNEQEQMAIRYVRFNVEALQQIATTAVGAAQCNKIVKTHEGSYNKIFLLQFDNKAEVIAKIPTKLIPPFYTTASEVATMDFARTVLGLSVPQVIAWSAHANNTPVGAEFIIMRRCPGVELRKQWDNMSGENVSSVIDQVLEAERKFGRLGAFITRRMSNLR